MTIDSPQTYALGGLFFDQGGGDSWEIAIRDASAGEVGEYNLDDWVLLGDGQLGWGVEVPEPSTLAMLGIGTIGLLLCAWRRRRA